jgi:hypothetical protein
MFRYCVYFLDEARYTVSFDVFEAIDDQTAIALCEPKRATYDLELWCEGRKVATIDRAEPQPRPGRGSGGHRQH